MYPFPKKNWERTFSGSAVHTTGSTRTLLISPKFIGAKHRDQAKLIKKSSFEAGRLHSKKQLHCVYGSALHKICSFLFYIQNIAAFKCGLVYYRSS